MINNVRLRALKTKNEMEKVKYYMWTYFIIGYCFNKEGYNSYQSVIVAEIYAGDDSISNTLFLSLMLSDVNNFLFLYKL